MMAEECRWCFDEICTNACCPMVADYCPVPDTDGVCMHEDRRAVEYAESLDVDDDP